jgi:hypothetical protein
MVVERPGHVAIAPLLCPEGVVVELKREIVEGKEGEGGRPTTILLPIGHAWLPLNPYFHPPLHLAPIMLTPLTKSIKSKENSFHPFPNSSFFEMFRFYIMQ